MFQSKLLSMSATLAITAAGLAIVAEAPAVGQKAPFVVTAPRADDQLTQRVSYADLNLASVRGEKSLYRRVGSAVEIVCPELQVKIEMYAEAKRCRKFAWGGARPQIERAVTRAREIASTGKSSIAIAAIQIHVPR